MTETLGCITIGYAIGCINPSYIIGKLQGFDIRKSGSGNAGGSNALIVMGKLVGIFCMLFDILKAFFAVRITKALFGDSNLFFSLSAVSVITGHIFPFYMGFRGGKGLACLGGAVLAYSPLLFLIMLICGILIALITDYICFVPLIASIAFPVIFSIMTKDVGSSLILVIITVIMWYRHIENLKRIKNGTEMHLSYLWHKNEELERIGQGGNH